MLKKGLLSDAQLRQEMEKCEYCQEKPCQDKCPAHCSPADFIMAARKMEPADLKRAAAMILSCNPLGGVCGAVCPDQHCMSACVYKKLNQPVDIPSVQMTIIEKASQIGQTPNFMARKKNGQKVAIAGAGPAGLAAAASLVQLGFQVDIYEQGETAGGMCNIIPSQRLPQEVLDRDLEFILSLDGINLFTQQAIQDLSDFFTQGYNGVVAATGLMAPIKLGIPGEETTVSGLDFLARPKKHLGTDQASGKVMVIGGGATAADCALIASSIGCSSVEMVCLEKAGEMPLTQDEREEIILAGVEITGRCKLVSIESSNDKISRLKLKRIELDGDSFDLTKISDQEGTVQVRDDIDLIIVAIGSRNMPLKQSDSVKEHIVYAGDCHNGPTTVVEAVASGKNAAIKLSAALQQTAPDTSKPEDSNIKSTFTIPGYHQVPVDLETDYFGRALISPFLLSAAPPTDGLEQMEKAYQAGWAGGVMKTAFNGLPIHIPAEYMFQFNRLTYANCDNVSGHPLDRICREVEQLVEKYPDRLTIASTGGPVTGDDQADRQIWQENTRMLEDAGAMSIEYSLSCPQGGDGTEGDIVSQNAALTAKIIGWIMEASQPQVPKLFKMTGAVTSIKPIIMAVNQTLAGFPDKKAGVTLANSFPSLAFRRDDKGAGDSGQPGWDPGIVVGMSGDGITPISYMTLANAAPLGVTISGNGGPMDYLAAANFLALGASTVQFCTLAMKYGYDIIHELCSGLSHLLQQRGIESVSQLIGRALPNPIADFMELPADKKVSCVNGDLCISCGNCTRCPYLAVSLDNDKIPKTDPSRCIGCSICVKKCVSGALYMRQRDAAEKAALRED